MSRTSFAFNQHDPHTRIIIIIIGRIRRRLILCLNPWKPNTDAHASRPKGWSISESKCIDIGVRITDNQALLRARCGRRCVRPDTSYLCGFKERLDGFATCSHGHHPGPIACHKPPGVVIPCSDKEQLSPLTAPFLPSRLFKQSSHYLARCHLRRPSMPQRGWCQGLAFLCLSWRKE